MSRFLQVDKHNNVIIEKMNNPSSSEDLLSSMNYPKNLCTIKETDDCPTGYNSSISCATLVTNTQEILTNYCAINTPS